MSDELAEHKQSVRTTPRDSNARKSDDPVGKRPMLLHLYRPRASVNILHAIYVNFCRTSEDEGSEGAGAKGANANVAHEINSQT